jgi:NADPH-dependent 2,4-dienoyl-CoA reductase/sulfur reductase-like enzyme
VRLVLRATPGSGFGTTIGELVAATHTEHGVHLRCGIEVSRFVAAGGRATGVELTDHSTLAANIVLVAVGAVPATGWRAGGGLPLGDGVECAQCCQAAPGVWPAGDVASWHNEHAGTRMCVEHRMNATEQAIAVAGNVLGEGQPFAPVPFFWTDQYDVKLQAYGTSPPDATSRIVSGDPADGRFIAAFGQHDVVTGVVACNGLPRELRAARQWVVDRTPWAPVTRAGAAT